VAIANGFTKYNNILGIASLFVTLPGYWILTKTYGAIGAAITFSSVQITITIIYILLINRKFIKLSNRNLYLKTFIIPIAISISATFLFNKFVSVEQTRLLTLLKIGLTVLITLLINFIVLLPLKDIKSEYLKILSNKRIR
jgi:O-antigen/teichoic acid export membrane protein